MRTLIWLFWVLKEFCGYAVNASKQEKSFSAKIGIWNKQFSFCCDYLHENWTYYRFKKGCARWLRKNGAELIKTLDRNQTDWKYKNHIIQIRDRLFVVICDGDFRFKHRPWEKDPFFCLPNLPNAKAWIKEFISILLF